MKKTFLAFISVCFLMTVPAVAKNYTFNIPDSSSIRTNLVERWFEASLETVRANVPEIYHNQAGQEFKVSMEESESSFNIFVAPKKVINVDIYSDKGKRTEQQDVFPGDAPGSWVIIRDKLTGKALRIRYYFLKNSEVFVQFTPNGKTALVDLVIFGNYASRGVMTGVPFSTFYDASFDRVMEITKRSIPWSYVMIDPTQYHSIMQMGEVIKEKLPFIKLTPDAMYDENDELIHISSGKKIETNGSNGIDVNDGNLYLSSAGIIKWIADGLVEPIAGAKLNRKPLLEETVTIKDNGYQGILSQNYNLFFGLDWVRNIATAVISVYTGKNYKFNQSGVDVTVNPFASKITDKGVSNIVTFVENTGYKVSVLKSLLYVLAATEPGTLYFGAIRETDRTVSPEIKVFNDCVVFLPYFTSDGVFNCYLYINGRALSLEDFCTIYKDEFVYLTRVKSSEQFFPQ